MKERKKETEDKQTNKTVCERLQQEVEMSTESRGRYKNKERLLSGVLVTGKHPQAPQVQPYYSDNCY